MASSTYYFDAHNGITDPSAAWTNDANAFNGNTTNGATTTNGAGSANLFGDGTTAPSSGDAIIGVTARIYGSVTAVVGALQLTVRSDSLALGLVTVNSSSPSWSSYTPLRPPAGGWTWQKVQDLRAEILGLDIVSFTSAEARRVEIEVTHEALSFNPAIARRRI